MSVFGIYADSTQQAERSANTGFARGQAILRAYGGTQVDFKITDLTPEELNQLLVCVVDTIHEEPRELD